MMLPTSPPASQPLQSCLSFSSLVLEPLTLPLRGVAWKRGPVARGVTTHTRRHREVAVVDGSEIVEKQLVPGPTAASPDCSPRELLIACPAESNFIVFGWPSILVDNRVDPGFTRQAPLVAEREPVAFAEECARHVPRLHRFGDFSWNTRRWRRRRFARCFRFPSAPQSQRHQPSADRTSPFPLRHTGRLAHTANLPLAPEGYLT